MFNPREDDNLGTIAFTNNRYLSGDKGATLKEAGVAVKRGALHLPVYAYIHSGAMIATKPFSCPWDSGQIGVIYCTMADIRRFWDTKRVTAALKKQALEVLQSEIDEYNEWLTGDDEE